MSTPEPFPDEPNNPGILLRLIRDQRVAFLIVGSINTLIGFGLFVAVDLLFDKSLDKSVGPVLASLINLAVAHVVGVLVAFVLYRRFVFRVRGHMLRDLARFESVYLVSIGINAIALPALVGLGAPRIPAQAVILVATTVLSYVGHRFFSFRRSPAVPPTESTTSSDPQDS